MAVSPTDRYFDNAATTRTDPRVVEAMLPYFGEHFANPHSVHAMGRRAMAAVDDSLETLADLLGVEDPAQLVVTSGATEANNWIFHLFPKVVVGPYEHSSIRETAAELGAPVINEFPTSADAGSVACWMWINNETGQMWPLPSESLGGGAFHCDITQGAFKIPVDLAGVDYASLSAHKFHGPNGVGLLYAKDPTTLKPFVSGGGQQHGLRSGTLPVPLIVGMAEAARITVGEQAEFAQRVKECRATVIEGLSGVSDWRANQFENQADHILSISFLGVEAQPLVMNLDAAGFAVGSGSACSAGSTKSSPVLLAMGIDDHWARGTVRISFSRESLVGQASELARQLRTSVEKLRSLRIK